MITSSYNYHNHQWYVLFGILMGVWFLYNAGQTVGVPASTMNLVQCWWKGMISTRANGAVKTQILKAMRDVIEVATCSL